MTTLWFTKGFKHRSFQKSYQLKYILVLVL